MCQLREFRRGLEQAKASRIEPCLPSRTVKPPTGPGWLHEIKHDGFRMMIRRDPAGVRVITRSVSTGRDGFRLCRKRPIRSKRNRF
jgi:bifunctional non-homologous end joining protein LigD